MENEIVRIMLNKPLQLEFGSWCGFANIVFTLALLRLVRRQIETSSRRIRAYKQRDIVKPKYVAVFTAVFLVACMYLLAHADLNKSRKSSSSEPPLNGITTPQAVAPSPQAPPAR